MLTPWHESKFKALPDHPLSRLACEQVPGKDLLVYHCLVTNFFGIGYFLPESAQSIWPGAIPGTRVFKELVSLGTDLQAVGPEKIVELRERMCFNVKAAQATIRQVDTARQDAQVASETEMQSIRDWLSQTSGVDGPTSLWRRKRIKFSFGGRGGSKAPVRAHSLSFEGSEL